MSTLEYCVFKCGEVQGYHVLYFTYFYFIMDIFMCVAFALHFEFCICLAYFTLLARLYSTPFYFIMVLF